MRVREENGVGRFKVEDQLANNDELTLACLGHLNASKMRRCTVLAGVDIGASNRVLPETVAE